MVDKSTNNANEVGDALQFISVFVFLAGRILGENSMIMVIVKRNLNRTVIKTLQRNHSPVAGGST